MSRFVALILSFFWLAGCVSSYMGDRLLLISGELSEQYGECRFSLRLPDSNNVLLEVQVKEGFTVDYPIEPANKRYGVEILCGSTSVLKRELQVVSAKTEVDLGYIN